MHTTCSNVLRRRWHNLNDVSLSLTISVLVAHVDVVVLEAGALLGILVALDLGD